MKDQTHFSAQTVISAQPTGIVWPTILKLNTCFVLIHVIFVVEIILLKSP